MPLYRTTTTVNLARDMTQETRMVDAKNKAAALAYIAKGSIVVEAITARDAVELASKGIVIETVE